MNLDAKKFLHEADKLLELAENELVLATALDLIKSARGCIRRALYAETEPPRPLRDSGSTYGDRREIPKARNW